MLAALLAIPVVHPGTATAGVPEKNGRVAILLNSEGTDARLALRDMEGQGAWLNPPVVETFPEKDEDIEFLVGRNPDLYALWGARLYRVTPSRNKWVPQYRANGFALAPDGERIALLHYKGKYQYIEVANRSGNFRRVILTRKYGKGRICCMDWSPDGRFIAFTARNGISKVRVADSKTTHLVGDDVDTEGATSSDWSPSGDRLVYQTRASWIETVSADGTDRKVVVPDRDDGDDGNQYGGWPLWSADGELILFFSQDDSDDVRYHTITPEGLNEEIRWGAGAFSFPLEYAWETRCTIEATGDGGELIGTEGPDVICGRGGNDVIHGGGGNDMILGGGGHDVLIGGEGKDVLNGQEGRDESNGDAGDDLLVDVHGKDVLNGGLDNDHIHTRDRGADGASGGQGRDKCWINRDVDKARGC